MSESAGSFLFGMASMTSLTCGRRLRHHRQQHLLVLSPLSSWVLIMVVVIGVVGKPRSWAPSSAASGQQQHHHHHHHKVKVLQILVGIRNSRFDSIFHLPGGGKCCALAVLTAAHGIFRFFCTPCCSFGRIPTPPSPSRLPDFLTSLPRFLQQCPSRCFL